MSIFLRSAGLAVCIAAAIQSFTVGFLSPRLSLEVCRPLVTEVRQETYTGVPTFRLENRDGTIRVRTHSGTEISAVADIRAFMSDSSTPTVAHSYMAWLINSERTDEMLTIVTEPKERPEGLELIVNYEIGLPVGTNLEILGSNGNIYVAAGCGFIDIESNNSDIEIYAPRGRVETRVANGRIELYDAEDGAILETVNGSIYAHLQGGSLQASTANGNIIAHLRDVDVDACDLTAMNGGITLAMAEQCSAQINATTGGGMVRSDVLLSSVEGVRKRHALHGTIGDGRTRLTMNSLNGDIVITRSET